MIARALHTKLALVLPTIVVMLGFAMAPVLGADELWRVALTVIATLVLARISPSGLRPNLAIACIVGVAVLGHVLYLKAFWMIINPVACLLALWTTVAVAAWSCYRERGSGAWLQALLLGCLVSGAIPWALLRAHPAALAIAFVAATLAAVTSGALKRRQHVVAFVLGVVVGMSAVVASRVTCPGLSAAHASLGLEARSPDGRYEARIANERWRPAGPHHCVPMHPCASHGVSVDRIGPRREAVRVFPAQQPMTLADCARAHLVPRDVVGLRWTEATSFVLTRRQGRRLLQERCAVVVTQPPAMPHIACNAL